MAASWGSWGILGPSWEVLEGLGELHVVEIFGIYCKFVDLAKTEKNNGNCNVE